MRRAAACNLSALDADDLGVCIHKWARLLAAEAPGGCRTQARSCSCLLRRADCYGCLCLRSHHVQGGSQHEGLPQLLSRLSSFRGFQGWQGLPQGATSGPAPGLPIPKPQAAAPYSAPTPPLV